jgi:hypothetical protein
MSARREFADSRGQHRPPNDRHVIEVGDALSDQTLVFAERESSHTPTNRRRDASDRDSLDSAVERGLTRQYERRSSFRVRRFEQPDVTATHLPSTHVADSYFTGFTGADCPLIKPVGSTRISPSTVE